MTDSKQPAEKIDPLFRAYVPVERRNMQGRWTFHTLDKTKYVRDLVVINGAETVNGPIRRATPKIRGKAARRAEKAARRLRAND